MFSFSPMSPILAVRYVLFGFDPDELRALSRIIVYVFNLCKFFIWHNF